MGKKHMRQHIQGYVKTMIYRYVVNSKNGITTEDVKKKLSVTAESSEEFDACMKELKDDDLILYDSRTRLWRAA
jgi:hypothetical protein